MPSTSETTARCQISHRAGEGQRGRQCRSATAFAISVATRMRFCGIRSAATPPTSTARDQPRLAPVATSDRSAGPPPSCDHLPDDRHQPDAGAQQRHGDGQRQDAELGVRERLQRSRRPYGAHLTPPREPTLPRQR